MFPDFSLLTVYVVIRPSSSTMTKEKQSSRESKKVSIER